MASDDLLLTSRFKYMERPIRNPGTCSVCGAPDRPVVDFGANLHQRNSVWVLYLCGLCVTEAYHVVDIASGNRSERESKADRSLQTALTEKNLVAITREQLDALISISNDLGATTDALIDLDLEDSPDPTLEAEYKPHEPGDSAPKEPGNYSFSLDEDSGGTAKPVSSITL